MAICSGAARAMYRVGWLRRKEVPAGRGGGSGATRARTGHWCRCFMIRVVTMRATCRERRKAKCTYQSKTRRNSAGERTHTHIAMASGSIKLMCFHPKTCLLTSGADRSHHEMLHVGGCPACPLAIQRLDGILESHAALDEGRHWPPPPSSSVVA